MEFVNKATRLRL